MAPLKLAGLTIVWSGPREASVTELLTIKNAFLGERRSELRTILTKDLEVDEDDPNLERIGACTENVGTITRSRAEGWVTREIHVVRPAGPFAVEKCSELRALTEAILSDLTRGVLIIPESSLIDGFLAKMQE